MKAKFSLMFLLFLLLSANIKSYSQDLSITDIDASFYPSIKAKLFITDNLRNAQTNITADQIKIYENNTPCKSVSITCNPSKPVNISALLTLDVSGSMEGANLHALKAAAKTFIQLLPEQQSECGIITFDDFYYLNADFTNDKLYLIQTVESLKAKAGTNYNVAFDASFQMLNNAKYRKFMIFLTDGMGNANQTKIIADAVSKNLKIYCITVGINAPQELKNIAEATKGKLFENVKSKDDMVRIFSYIFLSEYYSSPCDIKWKSPGHCTDFIDLQVKIPHLNAKTQANYIIPYGKAAGVSFNKNHLTLLCEPTQTIIDTSIEITAKNADYKITSIQSSNSDFIIKESSVPFTLKSGETKTIKISIKNNIPVFKSTQIKINTPGCTDVTMTISLHVKNITKKEEWVQVTFPNGDEKIIAGTDTVITALKKGNFSSYTFEYSIDSGKTWINIPSLNKNAIETKWSIPSIATNKALVRVRGNLASAIYKDNYSFQSAELWKTNMKAMGIPTGNFSTGIFSPGGDKFLISMANNKTYVFNTSDGKLLYSIDAGYITTPAYFSGDGTKILIYEKNKKFNVLEYTADKGTFRREYPKLPAAEFALFLSDDETIVLGDVESNIYFYNYKTGKLKNQIHAHANYLRWISISNSKNYLLTASFKGEACVWDLKTLKKVFSVPVSSSFPTMQLSANDTKLFVGDDEQSNIYDLSSKKKTFVEGYFHHVSSSDFEGRYVYCCGKIIEFASDYVKKSNFQNHIIGTFSPDNKLLLSDLAQGTLSLHQVQDFNQAIFCDDVSDKVFSIVKPILKIKDIDFGTVIMGSKTEITIPDYIVNIGNYDAKILNVDFSGSDARNFKWINQSLPDIINSNSQKPMEFKFEANKLGENKAIIQIITATDTLKAKIIAKVIKSPLQNERYYVNMGKIKVAQAKDSVLQQLLKVVNPTAVSFQSYEWINNDNNNFAFDFLNSKRIFANNEYIPLKLSYKPTRVGKNSALLALYFQSFKQPIYIQIEGEGIAKPMQANIIALDTLVSSTNPIKIIKTEKYNSKNMQPLLNYIFFDENSAIISQKYIQYDAETAKEFNFSLLNNYGALKTYYQILNIVGKRMNENPNATLRLVGTNSNEGLEKGNTNLSKSRAENIKKYLVEVWAINKSRITVEYKNIPDKPSVGNLIENYQENRRVELYSTDVNILKPMISDAYYLKPLPNIVTFKPLIESEFPIKSWQLGIWFDNLLIKSFQGTGALPAIIHWYLSNDQDILPQKNGMFTFQITAINNIGQSVSSVPKSINYEISNFETSNIRSKATKYIDKYELILFNYNDATLTLENKKIVEFVKTQIKPNSQVTIMGYTDYLGETETNATLSTQRANNVYQLIGKKDAKYFGNGESILLFEGKTPEERFYMRTVHIVVETPIE